jgi:hypothetical protein
MNKKLAVVWINRDNETANRGLNNIAKELY